MYDIEKINNDLKNNLSQFRYEHCLMVANEAKKLAHHYHCDENKAYLAGLVHDIAKEFSEEENKMYIKKYNLSSDLLSPKLSNIIHADIGAVIVKDLYNLDNDIGNSIKYHAIGNISMNILDKIVFVADKIARKNTNLFIDKTKELAYKNLDMALVTCLMNQQNKLKSIGKKLHPESIKLLKFISIKND